MTEMLKKNKDDSILPGVFTHMMDHLNHVYLSSAVNSNLRLSIKKTEYTYNL